MMMVWLTETWEIRMIGICVITVKPHVQIARDLFLRSLDLNMPIPMICFSNILSENGTRTILSEQWHPDAREPLILGRIRFVFRNRSITSFRQEYHSD